MLLSLLLITVSFRAAPGSAIRDVEGAAAAVLRPFQVGAERVVRPFGDLYGWAAGLAAAKEQNEQLRREVEDLRARVVQNETARQDAAKLRALLEYRGLLAYPADYRGVAADIVAHAPSQFVQRVVIAAGASDGVRLDLPVVSGEGLVGRITDVTPATAEVTLLTDESSAVAALDLDTSARGLVLNGRPGSGTLVLDRVEKRYEVRPGDEVVTAGSRVGELPSLYPRGVPIGRVTSVGQRDTDLYKRIQVEPHVDFSALESVVVLVPAREQPRRTP